MSEPRNPSDAGSEDRIALEQQYEEARRRAQQQTAIQGGRRSRRIQTNTVHPIGAKDPASFAAQAQAAIEAKAAVPEPAPAPIPEKPLTRAQQQALALRRAAAQRQAQATVRPQPAPPRPAAPAESRPQPAPRAAAPTPAESRPQPDEEPVVSKSAAAVSAALSAPGARPRQGRTVQRSVRRSEPAPQPSAQPPVQPSRPEPPVQPPQPVAPRPPRPENRPPEPPSADAAKTARLLEEMESHPKAPRKKAAPAAGTKSSGKKSSANGGQNGAGGKKKKKKGGWWKILLATLLVLALIVFGTFALIMQALKPETGGNITLSQLLNTPREYADKEFNVLLVGIDRSTENAAAGDGQVNDGLTDMIMWLHFNNETGEVKMLQIPRNILVTSDWNYSNNYQINAIAKSNGEAGKNDLNALCTYVANAFQVSIDGYITVRLEKLVDLVDIIGGVQVYVPMEMDYNGSHLDAGYQNMDGAACEFFLRTRHIYADSDLGRLNMQRYFYAAMFAKLRSMSMWDIAKNLPFYLSMVDTSLDAGDLVSVAVSLLKVSSEKIMLAQVPVYMGGIYYPIGTDSHDVVIVARQEAADLLNTYYRENTGPVDASQLNLMDGADAPDYSGRSASDPNVQFMGDLNKEIVDAQQNQNLDGSGTLIGEGEFVYDVPAESDAASGEAEPAA